MTTREKIAAAQERLKRIYAKRPEVAQGGSTTRCVLKEGLLCEVQNGDWRLQVDQPLETGGDNTAPDPGVYGRASLSACLTQGYVMVLAEHGITPTRLEVEVSGRMDARASVGMEGGPSGYQGIAYSVVIEADAPRERIEELLRESERRSPWLYNFLNALSAERKVEIA
ncbi:OsmC family protein [Limibacillus halophilus]